MARPKKEEARKGKAIAYAASQDVYVDGRYYKVGEVFVTDAVKGSTWDEVTKVEKAAADGLKPIKDDVPLEGLDSAALQAIAVDKGVNPKGLSDKEMIDLIKAADDPTR